MPANSSMVRLMAGRGLPTPAAEPPLPTGRPGAMVTKDRGGLALAATWLAFAVAAAGGGSSSRRRSWSSSTGEPGMSLVDAYWIGRLPWTADRGRDGAVRRHRSGRRRPPAAWLVGGRFARAVRPRRPSRSACWWILSPMSAVAALLRPTPRLRPHHPRLLVARVGAAARDRSGRRLGLALWLDRARRKTPQRPTSTPRAAPELHLALVGGLWHPQWSVPAVAQQVVGLDEGVDLAGALVDHRAPSSCAGSARPGTRLSSRRRRGSGSRRAPMRRHGRWRTTWPAASRACCASPRSSSSRPGRHSSRPASMPWRHLARSSA